MTSLLNARDKLSFKNNGRLKLILTIAMLEFLADKIMTRWIVK